MADHDDGLWRRGALELAALVRTREVSAVEVVEAHLDRIEEVNGELNAVVVVLLDDARAAAAAADAALAEGAEVGPLHGVPCTVKENIDLAGTATTQGVAALAEAVADRDAPVVERLRGAGAIPIGRTNLPDLGLRINTVSQLRGATRNPWDPTRTAGGSSGGEAAAIATGMSPLGLGNDLGGSLRNPAHCCGIASIKPSFGVVPSATVIPPQDSPLSFQLMGVQGVMARRVADVRAGLEVVAGQHPRDPLSIPVAFPPHDPSTRLRVALLPDPPRGTTHPGIAAAVRRAGDLLADAGHEVVEATPPSYERAIELWGALLAGDLRQMAPVLDEVMGEDARTFLHATVGDLPDLDLAGQHQLHVERSALARAWAAWHQQHDVLISPIWTQPAFELDFDVATAEGAAATAELFRPVLPVNLLGTPAAAVPVGTVDELPVALQVIGPRYTEPRCLALAEELEGLVDLELPIDPVRPG